MKNEIKLFVLTLSSLLLVSCSNMTVGFEEDSPLYNGPIIDTREGVESEKETQVESKTISEEKAEEVVVQNEPKEQKSEEANIEVPKEATHIENETTFTYERDDE